MLFRSSFQNSRDILFSEQSAIELQLPMPNSINTALAYGNPQIAMGIVCMLYVRKADGSVDSLQNYHIPAK
jgi:uncharacterized membrane protein (DUF485 family)